MITYAEEHIKTTDVNVIGKIRRCQSEYNNSNDTSSMGSTLRVYTDPGFHDYLKETYGIACIVNDNYIISFKVVDEPKYILFHLRFT